VKRHNEAETALRFGLTAATDLPFSAPDYYYEGGLGDMSAGMKQLGPAAGFDGSLLVFLSLQPEPGNVKPTPSPYSLPPEASQITINRPGQDTGRRPL